MQIGPSNHQTPLSQTQQEAARKVIQEFNDVGKTMIDADNKDKVDLSGGKGTVKVEFSDLGKKESRVKYTGDVTYDPSSREVKNLFVTINYDKYGGVGTNYAFREVDANTVSYRRDEMYQEYPMCRYIQEFQVDKSTQEIKGYEAYEERDDYMPILGGSDADGYNINA
ncbi:MAG: hypothetical protein AB2L14_06180 [Candidatus Xenobiia bacterium LiM19]